jgi:CRISPR-associated protein Cas1
MPIFERPPLETLAMARDRWTPIYLEHGRLEVDDSSVKWISATGLLCRLPVATISAVLLGPGTTATHAAMKACADSNTPVCWVGEDGLRFYALGLAPNHANDMPRLHAAAWADKKRRAEIARRMFRMRFPDVAVESRSIKELRGMEGLRVRALYAEFGLRHGVTWKGRSYNPSNWDMADGINKALSAANASLYALCAAVVCSLGYLPSLGFVHDSGTLPFIYDVADLYKHITSIPAAFLAIRQKPDDDGELTRKLFKQSVEEERILQRIPKDLEALLFDAGQSPNPAAAEAAPGPLPSLTP